MPAQRGRAGDQDKKGGHRVLSGRPCLVAVKLDMFGKDELCEGEARMMIT